MAESRTRPDVRLAVPDLVSNSYFPAVAAVGLGYAADEGLDVELELLYPVTDAAAALAEGQITFLAGAAHAPGYLKDGWSRSCLLMALSQRVYWFLVVAKDRRDRLSSLETMADVTIAAAPGPDIALLKLFRDAGRDPVRDGIRLVPIPSSAGRRTSFGVSAAQALADGKVDAFWANGMGARIAVLRGFGDVVYDARRDDRRAPAFTFPALMAHSHTVARHPQTVAAMVRAVGRAQTALQNDPALARTVADQYFPSFEAEHIEPLVAADVPFYVPEIETASVHALVEFLRTAGLETPSPAQQRHISRSQAVAGGRREFSPFADPGA